MLDLVPLGLNTFKESSNSKDIYKWYLQDVYLMFIHISSRPPPQEGFYTQIRLTRLALTTT